jgi:cytoskeletal protein RodZ
MRGITLDEIAAATKIGTRSLKALEDEDFKKLPGGIFNKGFVRAYAKFLGINEEQAVADYLAACGEPEDVAEIDPARVLVQREEFEAKSKAASRRAKELQSVQTDSPSGFPWAALLGLVLILALAWGGRVGFFKYKAHREAQAQAQREAQAKAHADAAARSAAAQAAALAPTSAQPQPDAVAADASPAASTVKPGNFVVSIRARQKTWISITADGKYVMSGDLPASSQQTVQAHSRITLKIGNAGSTDVAFNGKSLPSLGADNEVRTVTINADGSFR